MKLHEYQAKSIFRGFGLPVPEGKAILSAEEAVEVAGEVDGPPWVVKAQILSGARGKGGGIKTARSIEEVRAISANVLGKTLITKQTGPAGKRINKVLIEQMVEIEKEFYLAATVDRNLSKPLMIFSPSGGMEIEEIAEESPKLIFREYIDPCVGWTPYHGRNLAYSLDPLPSSGIIKEIMDIMFRVYRIFMDLDCSLIEINPLVITENEKVIVVDAKMDIDDNALFRQKEMADLDDQEEKDPFEIKAGQFKLNYIPLDGDVGVMVNGAGLAMATMDAIKMAGAEPANFLDVGGGADENTIAKGFEIILEDKKVKAILINIFGGILRCDVLARGILTAAKNINASVPLIVRLEGTNREEGKRILKDSELKFMVAGDMQEAMELVKTQVTGE